MKINILKLFIATFCCLISTSWGTENLLSTPEEHHKFIRSSISSAESEIIIVSPFITAWRLTDNFYNKKDGLIKYLTVAHDKGVVITVFTDAKFDADKKYAIEGRRILEESNIRLKIVPNIHSKNLIIDNKIITFGSFNWLSADTDPNSQYYNYETTVIIKDEKAPSLVKRVKDELEKFDIVGPCIYSDQYFQMSAEEKLNHALKLYKDTSPNKSHYQVIAEHIIGYLFSTVEDKEVFKIIKAIKGIIIKDDEAKGYSAEIFAFRWVGHPDCIEVAEILLESSEKHEKILVAANRILKTGTTKDKRLKRLYEVLASTGEKKLEAISKEFEEGVLTLN